MLSVTHIAAAVATGIIVGAPTSAIKFIGVGAILPDIENPNSIIGRVFYFISIPLNKEFGHRRLIHSLIFWLPITIVGFLYYSPVGWLGFSAITHILLDCLTTSGVQLMYPVTEKIFVLAGRKFRFNTGSRSEYIFLIVLLMIVWGSHHISTKGGLLSVFASIIGNYKVAVENYLNEGNFISYIEGKLRHPTGNIEKGKWLIVGLEGRYNLAIYDEKKDETYHVKEGKEWFLKARLITTKEKWNSLKIAGLSKLLKGEKVFFKVKNKWHKANIGDFVAGEIVYIGECVFESI